MTPEEFAALQASILEESKRQTQRLTEIAKRLEFLAWGIVIAMGVVLMLSLGHSH